MRRDRPRFCGWRPLANAWGAGAQWVTLNKHRVTLGEVLARAVEVASPLLEKRGHQFELAIPDHPIVIEGDEVRLTQVFANLLINAAKYTPKGGRIDLEVHEGGSAVKVVVRDTGVGIAPELLPKIFDLYVQGHDGHERYSGGLGVGLTLVRTLVSMHGGEVEARSDGVDMGSTFTIRLPRVTTPHEEIGRPAIGAARRKPRARRILIVDDNEEAVDLLAEVLSAAGHQVQTAGNAAAALDLLGHFKPDVAILDIGLPVIDGYQLAERLRADCGAHAPRLIALSGYGQQKDSSRSQRAGFDVHFTKPVDPKRLLETILGASARR